MRFIQIIVLTILSLSALAYANYTVDESGTVIVPKTTDLQADGQLAAEKQLPILVMFSATHCGYCEAIKSDQLRPMLISGDYTDQVIIRELHIDSMEDVIDFDGQPIAADDLASKHNVWVTPTIMFFDAQGNKLAPKILGYNTPSMFGGYLDEHIVLSQNIIRTKLAQR